jgi:hypothetical protein
VSKGAAHLGPRDVFINIPFDAGHERIYLALIAGLVSFGLNPRSVLQIPANADRLRRLHDVISSCAFSLHDLCRVQLSRAAGFRVPRFNMPFELGIAVGIAVADPQQRYQWRTLEEKPHRLGVSLSDVLGYETAIHGGTVHGTLNALLDIFDSLPDRPLTELEDLQWVYRQLSRYRGTLGANVYRPNAFGKLVLAARAFVEQRVG